MTSTSTAQAATANAVKMLNDNVLHKTGDETAAGHKTFSSAASVGARAGTVGNVSLVVGNGYATKYGAFGQGNSVSAVGDVSFAHGKSTYASGI